MIKLLFTGGGSGGHIYPLIAIIREIKKRYPKDLPQLNLYYLGPHSSSLSLLKKEGVIVNTILSGKLRRYITPSSVFQNILDICIKLPFGFLQSLWYLWSIKPHLIFSKGGYGSIPVIFAAKIFKIPLLIHESDISPGLSTRIAANFAKKIFVSFPDTRNLPKDKIIISGNPIRKEITQGSKIIAKKIFQISDERPILLILGGSQGAQRINEVILNGLTNFLEIFEIIHQCGRKNEKLIKSSLPFLIKKEQQKYYHLFGFLDENRLKHAYKIADLIISRAGAGAIFEIAANGKPSILIPIPESAQDHQRQNAYFYAKIGAAKVIEEQNFKPNFLLEVLRNLFSKPKTLIKMGKNAKKFAKPNAAETIAKYIIQYLPQPLPPHLKGKDVKHPTLPDR